MTKQIIRYSVCAMAMLAFCGEAAAEKQYYLRPNVSDWTKPENMFGNETEVIPDGATFVSCAKNTNWVEYGATSWEYFQRAGKFGFETGDSTLIITIPDGLHVTNTTPLAVSRERGVVVKRGKGSLTLLIPDAPTSTAGFLSHRLRIEEGEVFLPQDSDVAYSVGQVHVAEGCRFHLTRRSPEHTANFEKATTYIGGLSGSGVVTNSAPSDVPLVFNQSATNEFSGRICGGIKVSFNSATADSVQHFTNPDNMFVETSGNGIHLSGTGMVFGVTSLGRATTTYPDETSSVGTAVRYYVSASGITLKCLADAPQEFSRSLILEASPFTFDAGKYGGVTFEGMISGYYGSTRTPSKMQHLILDGDNSEPCIFKPQIRCWSMDSSVQPVTNCTLHITKRGTGTYYFQGIGGGKHRFPVSEWRGALTVENGTIRFDSVAETNVNSSLGYATILQEPYCDVYDPARNVDYAVSLGGDGTVGTLQYVGSGKSVTSTRPIVLYSTGSLESDGDGVLAWSGISGRSDGPSEKILRLGGGSMADNTAADITGAVSVHKHGDGKWHLGGETSFTGDLVVDGGTLVVNSRKRYNRFKWVCKQCYGQETDPETGALYAPSSSYGILLQEFGLFEKNGKRINAGLTLAADPAMIGPGEAAFVDAGIGYTGEPEEVGKLFNEEQDAAWWVMPQASVKITNPLSYISLEMHLGDDAGEVAAYDFSSSGTSFGYHPSRWVLYGSYDGLFWDVIDSRDGESQGIPVNGNGAYASNRWNRQLPDGTYAECVGENAVTPYTNGYPVSVPGAKPMLENVRQVKVLSGRLETADSITLDSIAIDADGAGVLSGFEFAESGTLEVLDFPDPKHGGDLPGSYENTGTLANLRKWTVTVNGREFDRNRLLVRDGRLALAAIGFHVILR